MFIRVGKKVVSMRKKIKQKTMRLRMRQNLGKLVMKKSFDKAKCIS